MGQALQICPTLAFMRSVFSGLPEKKVRQLRILAPKQILRLARPSF